MSESEEDFIAHLRKWHERLSSLIEHADVLAQEGNLCMTTSIKDDIAKLSPDIKALGNANTTENLLTSMEEHSQQISAAFEVAQFEATHRA